MNYRIETKEMLMFSGLKRFRPCPEKKVLFALLKYGSYPIKTGISQTYAMFRFPRIQFIQDKNCKDGNLVIKEPEASAVRLIFESYLEGYSILGLRKLLLEKGINSPTNKIIMVQTFHRDDSK